jgi:uncharacterized membrane protein
MKDASATSWFSPLARAFGAKAAPLWCAAPSSRLMGLDALRGLAVVWMAVFHFCFDLAHFRLIDQNFYADPFWRGQRTLIVSLFLLCAGMGQAIAVHQGQSWARFGRRWAQVAACALLVTLGSWWMFPNSFITFGVLHGMAVMLVLTRLCLPLGRGLWVLGLLAVALPFWFQHPFFDTRATNWVGLVTHKPITEDYVPVLPWWGVMLMGAAVGQWLMAHRPQWLAAAELTVLPACRVWAVPLATLGRWSLSFYMVHQPVFLGLLTAWMAAAAWWRA